MMQGTWFIAGISSSFGRKIAEQLLARGDQVIGTIRRTDSVKDLKARFSDPPAPPPPAHRVRASIRERA